MEVKVYVQNVPREVVVNTELTQAEVEKSLASALEADGVFKLIDTKGRTVLINAKAVGYLDFDTEHARQVGFGTL
ncbi:MAG: DUF3107 domain-containing protein [Propionibacteriaceae bacterium]|jgi:hypothetical protein|nr:DUF3107 domain-containing protein [Propionibacteriaceae bacterium]